MRGGNLMPGRAEGQVWFRTGGAWAKGTATGSLINSFIHSLSSSISRVKTAPRGGISLVLQWI